MKHVPTSNATSSDLAFSFLQGAPLAILAVDERGLIAFANMQAVQLFGFSELELIGQPVERLIPQNYRARHPELMQSFLREPHARVMGVGREVRAVDRQGREFPVEIGLMPAPTSGGRYVVAAITDITVRKRLEREVTAAKLVQEAMLPQSFPQEDGCEIGGATRFADAAGGDFLDCVVSQAGEVTMMIGDASGHGFASALVSVAAKAYLRALSRQYRDLGLLLTAVNQLLVDDLADGRFVTLFVGQLLVAERRFRYAGAGHVGYVLSRECDLKSQLVSTGPPLGWLPEATYTTSETTVEPGDFVLLMTDGIEEGLSPDDHFFGRERVFQSIGQLADRSVAEQAKGILDAAARFTKGQQHDDMSVLLARLAP
jgi:PAS domain S-box-containing protein